MRYTGSTPVKHRDMIDVCLDIELDEWIVAKVGEALAVQFTAVHGKGKAKHMSYFFYRDEGVTWKQQSQ